MSVQSEAALENGLIDTLQKMNYEYVHIEEEEEPIDIHAVMKEIKDLEAKRADLDKEIEGYLKELGLVLVLCIKA